MGFFDKLKNALESGNKSHDKRESQKNEAISDNPRGDSLSDNKNRNSLPDNQNRNSSDNNNVRNFKYLDDLIHSGQKDIVLDCDIVLADSEIESYKRGIDIGGSNITLDGNGHVVDGRNKAEIFKVSSKNLAIKNLRIENGYSELDSIIDVFSKGELHLSNCSFFKNSNESHRIFGDNLVCIGSIIRNMGELTIHHCHIRNNSSRGQGGTIKNTGTLNISDSIFEYNLSLEDGGAIFNEGLLKLSDSRFEFNHSNKRGGAIHNEFNGETIIENSSFDKNGGRKSANDISNRFNLVLKDMHSDLKIDNEWTVFIEKGKSFDIDNKGGIIEFAPLNNDEKSFTFLKELLDGNDSQIDLMHDIKLDIANDEQLYFPDGINFNRDNLIFNGNGHTIDALRMRNIFTLAGNDIIFRNVNLENGFSKLSNGAAISMKEGFLKIYEVEFRDNAAYNGGAISIKDASVSIDSSIFRHNAANAIKFETGGGAIYNENGSLSIIDTLFISNSSLWGEGGAILNKSGALSLNNCDFTDNRSVKNGNDISNYDSLRICKCSFESDKANNSNSDSGEITNSNLGSKINNSNSDSGEISIFNNNLSKLYDSNFNHSIIINKGLLKIDKDFPIKSAQIKNSGKLKAYNFNDKQIEGIDINNEDGGKLVFVIDGVEVLNTVEISQKWIEIKIFISSTFKDMHSERDYLITEVFPELSKWCKERRILLTEVDLRWGITREDSRSGNSINICLQYIDKCRPFFICFLGQRRGRIPEKGERKVTEETFINFPKISNLVGHLSVTEMEIEHATTLPLFKLLENDFDNEHAKRALFFLRENPFEDVDLSPAQRDIYLNRKPEDDEKLSQLKDLIREKCIFFDYSCIWDENMELYELSSSKGGLTDFTCNGRPLSEVIIAEVKKQIENEFPDYKPVKTDDIFLDDAMLQNLEIMSISHDFVGKQKEIDYINEFIESDNERLLLVKGAEGIGKNTLLSRVHALLNEKGISSIMRISNATAKSNSSSNLSLSIGSEIGLFNGEEALYKGVKHALDDEFLKQLSDSGVRVLIISNADKLNDRLVFNEIPDNLHIILSCGESYEIAIPHKELIIEGFEDISEREQLINEYLNHILKNLNQAQKELIISNPASKSPLFLKILLNELKNFGSYENLVEKIEGFGDSTLSAFEELLRALENDASFANGFARDTLLLLIYSKHGLNEEELVFGLESLSHIDARSKLRLFLYRMGDYILAIEDRYFIKFDEFKKAILGLYGDCEQRIREILVEIYKNNILKSPDSLANGSDEILYNLELLKDYDGIMNVLNDDRLINGIHPSCIFLGYKYGKFYGPSKEYLGFTMIDSKDKFEFFSQIALVLAKKSADSLKYAMKAYPHPHTQWPRKFRNENDSESFMKYQDAFYAIPMFIEAACRYANKAIKDEEDLDKLREFKSEFDKRINGVDSFLNYMSNFGSSQLDLGYKVEALADDAIFSLDNLNEYYNGGVSEK